jgi:hypothetical protein
MNGTNDCIAYINKLVMFGTNSPDKLLISASRGTYSNTNYYFDNTANIPITANVSGLNASNGVVQAGASPATVIYSNAVDSGLATHITNGFNVAGYLSFGAHSSLGGSYAVNNSVQWRGDSGWWIIETVESFNGVRYTDGQGNFLEWFSSNAFGGISYANTPIGAVSHVDEPGETGVTDASIYFASWESGKNFAICAWLSKPSPELQAVGDPFVTK